MKTCLPLMALTAQECISLIDDIDWKSVDLIEIRLDSLSSEIELKKLYDKWGEVFDKSKRPIIATFRTKSQGGNREASHNEYTLIIRKLIKTISIDYIDIEMGSCQGSEDIKKLIKECRAKNIKTIVSYHDMIGTDEPYEIYNLVSKIKELGCDFPKVAYMAKNERDVQKFIEGAKRAGDRVGEWIGISMGEIGMITRERGYEFGSIINFVKPMGKGYNQKKELGQQELRLI